jgi:hypothetical protein
MSLRRDLPAGEKMRVVVATESVLVLEAALMDGGCKQPLALTEACLGISTTKLPAQHNVIKLPSLTVQICQ